MVAFKAAQVDAFLERPNRSVVLIFGPDTGLVHERAEKLIRASVDDPADPFSLVRLEGADLTANPARLIEEANTIPLFGGRRAIWVRPAGRDIIAAMEALLASTLVDCRIVIEAGDLKRSSTLRALCEKSPGVAALPCYADAEKDIARLIDSEMTAAGLAIAPDARALLISLLGGDRLASRSELCKLALYVHGQTRVEIDDVLAVTADASALAIDALIDAAFSGSTMEVEQQFTKARTAGTTPGSIISAALRQLAVLHKARLAIDGGQSATDAVAALHLHFSRTSRVEAVLKAWSTLRLERFMTQLADATLDARKRPELAESIADRVLLSIAVNSRRR